MRNIVICLALGLASVAHAQFVWPKADYHDVEPGLYTEDPFIVKYRQEFFSVFKGDFKRFDKAYVDIEAMVKKNPKDARATVWLGTGKTIRALLSVATKKVTNKQELLEESRKVLDQAVSLRPEDPNIYMMRATTLYIQGQYLPAKDVPAKVWTTLRDDLLRFIQYVGPTRMPKASIHVRGEAYGELGIAFSKLGKVEESKAAFEKLIVLCPETDYAKRAQKELEKLRGN